MLLMEFNVSFAGSEDTRLKEVRCGARAPAASFAGWSTGAWSDQRHGLAVPDSVRRETDAYLREQDDLALWADAHCVMEDDPVRRCSTRELYDDYLAWIKQAGGEMISAKAFIDRLRAMGVTVDDNRSNGLRARSRHPPGITRRGRVATRE